MAFTYVDTLLTDRDHIRFKIGDTQANAGPRPDKRNFSDEEIAAILTDEGDNVNTIAALFETLAAEWQPYSLKEKEDIIDYDAKEMYKGFLAQAEKWRRKADGVEDSFATLDIFAPYGSR